MARRTTTTAAERTLWLTCLVVAAAGTLFALVGYPLLLIGVFGIGPGGANVRDQVLPVGATLGVLGVGLIAAAFFLWRRSIRGFRTVIVLLGATGVLIELVPIGADLAFRLATSLLCAAILAWLLRPPMRGLFVRGPGSGS